jgi:SAM-dependent methyltransferase
VQETPSPASLLAVRRYLDDRMYALVDSRLSALVGADPDGFPRFEFLQAVAGGLEPNLNVLFRLFRLGEPVDEAAVREAMPPAVLDAATEIGLLERDPAGRWRTANQLVVAVEGLFLAVSIPPHYPTCRGPYQVSFDVSSPILARALPSSLRGERVLDVGAGSGLQALVCAARGAERAIGLELDPAAVATARFNAALNGMQDRVEFRQSDLLGALDAGERFDYVVCNTPYHPMLDGGGPPRALHGLGNAVLGRLVDQLPAHLSSRARGMIAVWRAPGHRSSTHHMAHLAARLGERGVTVFAFTQPGADTADSVLAALREELERKRAAAALVDSTVTAARELLEGAAPPVDGFYNQLVCFAMPESGSTLSHGTVLGLAR